PLFERLLIGWRAQGYELVATRDLYASLETRKLPRHEVALGKLPGASETLMLQTKEFLAG
ncbi:MAG TPA: xylanase, partial [Burkholderiales bacterium]|nr:xylanase [Burkholderiales bacterium]